MEAAAVLFSFAWIAETAGAIENSGKGIKVDWEKKNRRNLRPRSVFALGMIDEEEEEEEEGEEEEEEEETKTKKIKMRRKEERESNQQARNSAESCGQCR